MRKFISLSLVAAIATLGVSAETLSARSNLKSQTLRQGLIQKEVKFEQSQNEKSAHSVNIVSMKKKQSSKRVDEAKTYSIEGDYTLVIDDGYFQGSVGIVFLDVTVEYDEDQQIYWMSENADPEEAFFITDVPFRYDNSTNTLTIVRVSAGQVPNLGYVFFTPTTYNQGIAFLNSSTAEFNPETSEIKFDRNVGFGWPVCSSSTLSTTTFKGWMNVFDVMEMYQELPVIDEVQEGQWKSLGMAEFVDGWILPSYTMGGAQINPNDYVYEVELQQNLNNENLYRLWKPYKMTGTPVYDQNLNLSTYDGQIVFDVSDPDHVVVVCNGLPSGMKNNNGEFYLSNELGWYLRYFDADSAEEKATIIGLLEDLEGTVFDTFEDGVITINTPMFDFYRLYSTGYSWNNSNYSVKITFPVTPDEDDNKDNPGDITETPTYTGSVSGSHTQEMSADDIKSYPYEFDYAITYNTNKTLSITLDVEWGENGKPVGYVDNNWNVYFPVPNIELGPNTAVDGVYTTTETYEEDQVVQIQFWSAVAMGRVEINTNYTVGSTNTSSGEGGDDEGDLITGTGTMSAQTDMNGGQGEPELLDPENYEVTATYNPTTHKLTIVNFADLEPITFIVDTENGTAESEAGLISTPDDDFPYYYCDLTEKDDVLYATVEKLDDTHTLITVDNWGECLGELYDHMTISAFYNTKVTLNFLIPGLDGEALLPTLSVTASWKQEMPEGEYAVPYIIVSGEVTSENLPEGNEIKVYYSNPLNPNEVSTVETANFTDNKFEITFGSLEYNTDYSTEIYATCGAVTSETITVTFKLTTVTGVEGIDADAADAVYYDLQGRRLANPDKGIYVKVVSGKTLKVVK